MLTEIKEIFEHNSTDYRILICPAYNQKIFNREDLSKLQSIFGEQFIFDFSGMNEISVNKSNYYDEFHFKRYVGARMMDKIYSVQ